MVPSPVPSYRYLLPARFYVHALSKYPPHPGPKLQLRHCASRSWIASPPLESFACPVRPDPTMASMERPIPTRERRPSMGAPIVDIVGPVGPAGISRPKHKRTFTGFGAGEIKSVEASIPEPQREAWIKHQFPGFQSKEDFEREVVRHVETTLARSLYNCDETAAYSAASLAFRDRLIKDWNKTQQRQTFADSKRVYYLSLEFLSK
ncbi:hypothetical protein F4823DRAFT_218103 [Ustulina deusta]|nr:hypothetical protein F4823DRAFT_218103 [Ustulina deusta]